MTYYFVIDGYGGDCGEYTSYIGPPPPSGIAQAGGSSSGPVVSWAYRDGAVELWHASLELDPDQPKLRALVEKYRTSPEV